MLFFFTMINIRNNLYFSNKMSFINWPKIYGNRRQRKKSFKMIIEKSDKIQFYYFYVLNPFLNWPNLARPWWSFTWCILGSIIYTDVKFWHNLDSSPKIELLICWIDISYNLETMCFSALLKFCLFSTGFYYNFKLNGISKILIISSERSRSDILVWTLSKFKIIFYRLEKSIFKW